MIKTTPELQQLLREHRVQPSYLDVNHKRRSAQPEAMLALLRGLGVDIQRPEQAGELVQEARRNKLRRGVEPVLVAWNGRLKSIDVALPTSAEGALEYDLDLGEGRLSKRLPLESLRSTSPPEPGAFDYIVYRLPILNRLPTGYHQLRVRAGNRDFTALIISAPRRAYNHGEYGEAHDGDGREPPQQERAWGVFMPLYALRREGDWGAGDFTSLGRLAEWTGRLGGSAVGALPLLAASLDEPFEPSPYRPVSRRFWNELYIDVGAVPEAGGCEAYRSFLAAGDVRGQLQQLRAAELVDYQRAMALKRSALMSLARYFFKAKPAERYEKFQRFLAENPAVDGYARFRAAQDRQRAGWMARHCRQRLRSARPPIPPLRAMDCRGAARGAKAESGRDGLWALPGLAGGSRSWRVRRLAEQGAVRRGGQHRGAARPVLYQRPGLGTAAAASGTVARNRL
jgi:4-alpha-glucanotransferase